VVTEQEVVHWFRQHTRSTAALRGDQTGAEIERLEIREVGECAVEAWSPDGKDVLAEHWLDIVFIELAVERPTIVAEANGIWRAAW
jgi:hypothetical protein